MVVVLKLGVGPTSGALSHCLGRGSENKAGYQEFADAIVLFISLNFNFDTSSPVIVND